MLRYPAEAIGRVTWCGPFAIAIITGLTYEEAHDKAIAVENRRLNAAAKARGLRPGYWRVTHFKSMGRGVLSRTAARLGVKIRWSGYRKLAEQPTLLTFARDHTIKGRTYLILAGHHYVVVRDGVVYHSWHTPCPVEDMQRHRLARVCYWAEVKPRPAAILEPAPLAAAA